MVQSRTSRQNSLNPGHLTIISSTLHEDVIARSPEQVGVSLDSQWDYVVNQGGGSMLLNTVLQEAANLAPRNQKATAQVWTGNSPIELTLALEFYAEDDARTETINPIVELYRMALPKRGTAGLLRPPGPRIFSSSESSSDIIRIQIGSFLSFDTVIITNVSGEFQTSNIDSNGTPMFATATITFRTLFSFVAEDISAMFGGAVDA